MITKKIFFMLVLTINILQSQVYVSENFNSGLGSFTTLDEGSGTGDTWSSGNINSNTIDDTNAVYVSNNYSEGGGEGEGPYEEFFGKSASVAFKETLLSPIFDSSDATKLILKFEESYNSSNNNDIALVQVYNGSSWVTVHSHSGSAFFYDAATVEIDLASYKNASMQIKFVFDDLGVEGNYWMVDNVSVTNTSCSDPTGILISDIEDTSAVVNFTAGYSETAWEIIVQESSLDEPDVSGESILQNNYTATDLAENTTYEVYLRASCGGGDFSNWVKSSNFTTAYTCPKPDKIKSSNSTPNSIDISWTVNGEETEWEIEYGPTDFINDNDEGTIISNITSNPYTVTNLDSNTSYEFYVRAVCGEGNKSLWEGVSQRSTLKACEEPVDFVATDWSESSVDVKWTQGYLESSWEIEYGVEGFSHGSGTVLLIEQNSHTITDLIKDTAYDIYVRSICTESEQSEWVQLNSFTTLCSEEVSSVIEDFESYNSKFKISNEDCLLQDAQTSAVWYIGSGATPSNGTGPESGAGGSGYYAYLEANSNVDTNNGATADLHMNFEIDLSVFASPMVSFDYHMVGDEMGSLQLYLVDESGVSILLKEFVGEQQSVTSDDFLTALVDLNSYSSEIVRFYFRAVRGGTYEGDMAIDNFKVYDDEALSIGDLLHEDFEIHVYPNPTSSKLTIENINSNCNYELIDMSGLIVKTGEVGPSNFQLDLENLTHGVYILKIKDKVIRVLKN